MGWGHCGTDSWGREIGYCIEATCDHPGCIEPIDRGLSYVCGDMHGEDEVSCEKYYCAIHKQHWVMRGLPDDVVQVCDACLKKAQEAGYVQNEEEGYWEPPAEWSID